MEISMSDEKYRKICPIREAENDDKNSETSSKFIHSNNDETWKKLFDLMNALSSLKMCRGYKADFDIEVYKLIGDILNIDDYRVNLFSKWMLKTIIQKSIQFLNDLTEQGYSIFIFWIYEEFSYLQNNLGEKISKGIFMHDLKHIIYLDIARSKFFELLNKVFVQVAIDINNGKLLNKNLNLEVFLKNEETKEFVEEVTDIIFQDISHEIILHAIVDASYEIFGNETDYSLIQVALLEQHKSDYYVIPYNGFRKPKKLGSQKNFDNKLKETENRISLMKKRNRFLEQKEFIQPLSKATADL